MIKFINLDEANENANASGDDLKSCLSPNVCLIMATKPPKAPSSWLLVDLLFGVRAS